MNPFPSSGRIAAFDFGTVRIGVAVCDPDWILASPLVVLDGKDYRSSGDQYQQIVSEERVQGIVVGLPVHADGNESPSSKLARAFAQWLTEQLDVPVRLFDERFTTVDASARMRGGGYSRQKKKQRIDAVAASVLLESFLEACRYRGQIVGSDARSVSEEDSLE